MKCNLMSNLSRELIDLHNNTKLAAIRWRNYSSRAASASPGDVGIKLVAPMRVGGVSGAAGGTVDLQQGQRACLGAPSPPHIWAGYERCRSARAFEARLRRPSGLDFRDRAVTGRPARAYEMSLRGPIVDALTPR